MERSPNISWVFHFRVLCKYLETFEDPLLNCETGKVSEAHQRSASQKSLQKSFKDQTAKLPVLSETHLIWPASF